MARAHFPYLILTAVVVAIYGPQISPIMGQGPSSILSAAVAAGGFGPVPGYPIHNLIARAFLAFPFASPAYALNIASFAMAVFAVLALTRLLARVAEYAGRRAITPTETFALGSVLAFFYFQSPSLARVSFFGDRYTTELFFLVVSANFFVDALLDSRLQRRGLIAMAFFSTFMFFCHAKSLPFVWFFALVLIYRARSATPWLAGMIAAAVGFAIPVAILVITSVGDPYFDWNNPENARNVLNSILRKEYQFIVLGRTWADWMSDWSRQYRLLFQQFPRAVYALALVGLAFLFRRSRAAGALAVAALAFCGEWTAYVQHFINPGENPILARLYDWLMLNYYGPYFALIAMLAVFGIWSLATRLPRPRAVFLTLAGCALALSLFFGAKNSFRGYAFTDELVANFEAAVPEGAILFTNIDSLFSPLIHGQLHHGRMKNRYLLHTELMFRSWYYDDLERMYPALWRKHGAELAAQRERLREFEQSGYDERRFDIRALFRMFDRVAENHMSEGSHIFFDPATQLVRRGLFADFRWEPEALTLRLVKGGALVKSIAFENFRFAELRRERDRGVIWAERYTEVFAKILDMRLKRARIIESEEAPKLEALIKELR